MKNLLQFRVKAFALTVIFLISISGILFAQPIAIIDAGSSGSRCYLYNIESGQLKRIETPQKQYAPLSNFKDSLDKINDFLSGITTEAATAANLGQSQSGGKIPLYILATAGMRLVEKSSADSIYARIFNDTSHIHPRFKLEKAMTISGRYEGLYAWIAANYRNGRITYTSGGLAADHLTYGILEIGGASLQIAFARPSGDFNPSDAIVHSNFGPIYSKSYLGGGVDQIFKKYKDAEDPISFNELFSENRPNYDDGILFLGLGRPIENVLKSNTVKPKKSDDATNPYHPWMTDHYITAVKEIFGLTQKLSTPEIKSSWTEGAALDIIINKRTSIEEYNYTLPN